MKNKKLQLGKHTISNLQKDMMSEIKTGLINKGKTNDNNLNFWTFNNECSAGCTDGCTVIRSWFNCTKVDCTNNCPESKKAGCHSAPKGGVCA